MKNAPTGSRFRRSFFWTATLPLMTGLALSGAAYEITSPNPVNQGRFGRSIAIVPDLNGDGRSEILVGAPQETSSGFIGAGRAYLFSGSSGALLRTLDSPDAEVGGSFGFAVSGVPDLNADGKPELAVGAPNEDPGSAADGSGRVYVFNGATGGLLRVISSPGEQVAGQFGYSVASLPDVSGDNKPDLVIGAPYENPDISPEHAGRAYIMSGANGSLVTTLISPNEQSQGLLGYSVAAVPDVPETYRGYVVVGAPFEGPPPSPASAGRAYIFDAHNGTVAVTLQSNSEESDGEFGLSVSGISDVNSDGLADVVVGAPSEDPTPQLTDAGRVVILSGQTGQALRSLTPPNAIADQHFGTSVAGFPDINNDFKGDLVVGSPGAGATVASPPGRAYLYSGGNGTLIQTINPATLVDNGEFGMGIAAGPDLTGDGKSDFAVWGSSEPSAATKQGKVHTFSGADGLDYATPTPSPTPSPSATASPTPTSTPTDTPTPTDTETPTPTETPSPTPAYNGREFGDFDNSHCTDLNDFLFLLDNWELEVDGTVIGLNEFLALLDYWLTGDGC